jgi:copper resistance protein B
VRAADAHAGHEASEPALLPIAGPPAEALSGPENAADLHFGESAMSLARRELGRMHGNVPAYRVLFDRVEARLRDGPDSYLVDAQAWYGGDIDKLWLKAEGNGTFGGGFEGAEVQALWSHAIGPWFDLQTGAKYDVGRGDDRVHAVLGVQGLAPYWIEVEAAAFLSDRSDVTARIEAEHDARITQRLILQPRLELHLALQDIPEARVGAGLATGSLGARLRYEVTPLFGPYIGVEYARAFGETRDRMAAANEDVGGVSLIAGVRAWF